VKPLWLVGALGLGAVLVARRRRLEPTLLAGGLVAVAGALLYGLGLVELPNLERLLEDLGRTLGPWTYLLVGGLAFLETGAFVGLLAPGETTILVGGVVAGQGEIDIVALVALVWACSVAGDLTSFYLGRRLGRGFLEAHGAKVSVTPERLEKVEVFFAKHGGKAILLGRFVGLVRAIAPFLAGSSGMSLRRFLPYDVIGAGLWGSTFCLLGYLFWQSFGTVLDYAKTGTLALGTTIVVVAAVVWLVRFFRVQANRARLRARVAALQRRAVVGPVLRALVRLGEQPARFAISRVTPGDLGLELTTLLALAGVGGFAVAGYAVALGPGEVAPGDVRGLMVADALRADWLTELAKAVSAAGHLWVTGAATAVACVALAVRRKALEAAAVGSGYVLMLAAEELVRVTEDRTRPPLGLVMPSTPGFPSAHVAHSVVWVAIAVAVARVLPGWGARLGVVVASVVLVALVGLTRLYLRAHYLSDVVAGAGLGVASFALCGAAAMLVGYVRHTVRAR
jgi:undecaprenyl-diphosphatase